MFIRLKDMLRRKIFYFALILLCIISVSQLMFTISFINLSVIQNGYPESLAHMWILSTMSDRVYGVLFLTLFIPLCVIGGGLILQKEIEDHSIYLQLSRQTKTQYIFRLLMRIRSLRF